MTKVICSGAKFYNSNKNVLNSEDEVVTNIIYENSNIIDRADTYEEKLRIWKELNLTSKTQYWIGDFTKIKREFNVYSYPEPDRFISIHPATHEQVIKFNLFNIHIAIEEIGCFDIFKSAYLHNLKGHDDNPLVRMRIRNDLNDLKGEVPSSSFLKNGVQHWYESFRDSQDTLNESNYSLFVDEPIKEMSQNGWYYGSPPFLRYLLDDPKYVFEAANGYLLTQKIPFLQELLNTYEPVTVSKSIATTLVTTADSLELQPEQEDKKKSKKKTSQLTTKQQLILLHKLGLPPILDKLTTQHKAAILAQLLFRNEQDIRSMLTYWGNVNAPKKYDCTSEDDIEKVIDLLDENNLQL